MNLQTPLSQADRIYKMYASRLEKLDIFTLEDFLYHLPSRYEDYSVVSKIGRLQPGEIVTIQGQVVEVKNQYLRSSRIRTIQKALITDETGSLELIWFNQPFLTRSILPNSTISVSGRVEGEGRNLTMKSPEYEVLYDGSSAIHTARLIPVYPETKGVSSKWLRRQIHKLLQMHKEELTEYLPADILKRFHFVDLQSAVQEVHFPATLEKAQQAKERLAFDELFLLQLASLKRRKEWQKNNAEKPIIWQSKQSETEKFIGSLPFKLTGAQVKAVKEILADLSHNKMNRLLQGDVGSGKTVVAAVAMYEAFLNGYQSILLAPTEILANQHFSTILNLLSIFKVKIGLVTGSKKSEGIKNHESGIKKSKSVKGKASSVKNEEFDILVGTHALLSEKIKLDRLAMVVIDEQQRFGVEQRSLIRKKGQQTHLLTMTATPIPRTVALTMYGELDLSYLNEMPIGRKRVKTWVVPPEKRTGAYDWIRKQVKETDSQVFIICPFIEQSENMQTVKAASKEFERLKKDVFPDLRLGLLHGRLKSKEKDKVMEDFKKKKFDILVATPVVEVGIDIPNATVILIEAAERFGLSQLHQLRGRVGRGDKQSYCLLFSDAQNGKTNTRLKALESVYAGAELAELDLKLRGPGDMYGTAQHGIPKLKVASFSDTALIQKARAVADEIFSVLPKFPVLQKKVDELTTQKVSPD